MYKISKYNLFNINSNGQPYIYNVLSGNCHILQQKQYYSLREGFISSFESDEIKKLHSFGYIVNEGKDEAEAIEYKYYQAVFDNETLDLTLIMTHACNLRCIYCYQKNDVASFDDNTQSFLFKFIANKLRHGIKKLYINWFGGEPMVEFNRIEKMGKEIAEIAKLNHVAYIGRITTNGYLLTADRFKTLLDLKIRYFAITIDGTKEIHDKQRPLGDGRGSYDTIINNLIDIMEFRQFFVIDIRVNVSPSNAEKMSEFLDTFYELFGKDTRFNLVFEAVHDWKGERIEENRSCITEDSSVVREIYTLASSKGINLQNYLEYRSDIQICPAVKRNGYYITGQLKVYKCEMAMNDDLYSPESEIGYINEQGQLVIEQDKEIKWLTRSKDLEKCYDCVAYPYCLGGAQCNYGKKYHKQMRCDDNIEYLLWSSELLSKKAGVI